VHTLTFALRDKPHWSLMVVVEHWRLGDREVLKTDTWARRLSGSSAAIISWAKNHDAVRRATR
jgi:hypothetical protein